MPRRYVDRSDLTLEPRLACVSGLFAAITVPSSSGCCSFSKAPQCRRVILIVQQPFDDKIDVVGWCCTGRTGERRSPGSRCPREPGLRSILQSAQVPLTRATRPGLNRHCGRWRRNCTQLCESSGTCRKANCRTGKCRAQHSAHCRSLRHPSRQLAFAWSNGRATADAIQQSPPSTATERIGPHILFRSASALDERV